MAVCRFRGFNIRLVRRYCAVTEYAEKPEYPPILDLSRDAKKKREKETRANKFKSLETVEEKLMEANMPRYYGWKCILLPDGEIPYNTLNFAQFVTRTHFTEQPQFPEYYSALQADESLSSITERIKSQIKEVFAFELQRGTFESDDLEDTETNANSLDRILTFHVNRVILGSLSHDYSHLQNCQVDHDPRLESAWLIGGMNPPISVEKSRKNHIFAKLDLGKPIDRFMQYFGDPILQLRHEFPLPPVVERDFACSFASSVPKSLYEPRTLGFHTSYRHVTNVPGFWPGDSGEFPLMSFHSSRKWEKRTYDDINDVPHVQAIIASYGWLNAIACYQGFSTFNDITYPLVTQTVVTNGQYWSFYVYQLNTILLHSENAVENPLCNICWGTPRLKLFESFENGEFVGFNDDVLKKLLCFYLNIPKFRNGIELKPYLGETVKHVADIPDDEKRAWLENAFKKMYTNQPKASLPYEIHHWEKIYKVDHDTRPLDKKKRPFEVGENPYNTRRYDEQGSEYIRKKDRKHKREKWAKTYYP